MPSTRRLHHREVQDTLKSEEREKPKPEKRFPFRTSRIGTLALGAIAIYYTYSSSFDSTGTPIPLCNRVDLWPDYEKQITDALNSCSATKELGEKAFRASLTGNLPTWHIKIYPSLPFSAEAEPSNGELRIRCDEKEPVTAAAFELTDFIQQKRLHEIWQQNLEGKIETRDEFAELIEKTQYNGAKMHNEAMKICQVEKDWQAGVILPLAEDWETYWEVASTHAHSEFYRKEYDRIKQEKQKKPLDPSKSFINYANRFIK